MQKRTLSGTLGLPAALLVALSFLVMVTVNALANALPLNGVNTGQLSDELPNLFVPAGITFSIWGLIYLLLAALSAALIVQARAKEAPPQAWKALDAIIFAVNALANSAWIFAWHWRLVGLSFIIMLVILATLILLAERIYARRLVAEAAGKGKVTLFGLALSAPIHVYLGWITVATIANATALLVALAWDGWGLDPRAWTLVVIVAGLAVAFGFIFIRRAVAAPLVVVWAYSGIVMKRLPEDGMEDPLVWAAAGASALAILVALGVRGLKVSKAAAKSE